MWELDYKESWVLKNWYFWTVVLEKTLENLLDCKEIQPVYPKRDQSWVFIGRTDVEAETPTLWPPDSKNWLIWKYPDAGKDRGQEEKGTTKDEMVWCHHRLNGHGFGWTPGVGDGQGGLVCCSSWVLQRVRYDWVTELNWADTHPCTYACICAHTCICIHHSILFGSTTIHTIVCNNSLYISSAWLYIPERENIHIHFVHCCSPSVNPPKRLNR